ncbi:Hypothetical predicted protein [Paramuricea clavata]|uniref:Uncharacterized protein n=1 Tax=Paramuricea clavata TaxID=317549 RepID=A0A6S7JXH0_PARCT|nr:Hypothetical predicted protein [Paramuricea clavata]
MNENADISSADLAEANSCSASCIKQSEEIDQLKAEIVCLKKSVKSSEYMQINRLQNDNSSLIKTVEMLTKQLLKLNTVDANIDPSSQVSKEPAPKVSKKQKKSKKKKMKAKEDIESTEKNVPPPRQAHAAPTSGMENVNDDVAATTSKNRAKEVVVIAGDSLIKNVVGASMSKTDPNHYYVVKAFPGANLSDMEDFIKPITRKSPEKSSYMLERTT